MIAAINIGTSSIKSSLFTDNLTSVDRRIIEKPFDIPDALHTIIDQFEHYGKEITQFGFRVVHGGEKLHRPTIVTDEILNYLDSIKNLAPLHNPPVVTAMRLVHQKFPSRPIVAIFDTGFHEFMPSVAKEYAVSDTLARTFHVQRYGFHGLAYASMLETYCQETNTPEKETTIIALQLGSGCSMCAIKNGQSIDTTMGFSPMEGLVSRTRSGDIDASLVLYLSTAGHMSDAEVTHVLNYESGLKGMGGNEGHMGNILKARREGNDQARHAIDLFVYRIQKYLGAYDAVAGGVKAFVFGGGISEHCLEIVQQIFSPPFFQVEIESQIFTEGESTFHRVSTERSSRAVYIVRVDEEKEIAKGVLSALTK